MLNGTSTTYTNNAIKPGTPNPKLRALLVTLKWNQYCVTQILSSWAQANHFIFDSNGVPYTAVVIWNENGTVYVTNRTDVYIHSISIIEDIA